MDKSITFALTEGQAEIVKRAAVRLGLEVAVHADGSFTVSFPSVAEAYEFGLETGADPDWAQQLLRLTRP